MRKIQRLRLLMQLEDILKQVTRQIGWPICIVDHSKSCTMSLWKKYLLSLFFSHNRHEMKYVPRNRWNGLWSIFWITQSLPVRSLIGICGVTRKCNEPSESIFTSYRYQVEVEMSLTLIVYIWRTWRNTISTHVPVRRESPYRHHRSTHRWTSEKVGQSSSPCWISTRNPRVSRKILIKWERE